jgi:hypothetical protein
MLILKFRCVQRAKQVSGSDWVQSSSSGKGGNPMRGWAVVIAVGLAGVVSMGSVENANGYTLTVLGGSGGGSYDANQVVQIAATGQSSQRVFVRWETSSPDYVGDVHMPTTNVTMPAHDMTVSAVYDDSTSTSACCGTASPALTVTGLGLLGLAKLRRRR